MDCSVLLTIKRLIKRASARRAWADRLAREGGGPAGADPYVLVYMCVQYNLFRRIPRVFPRSAPLRRSLLSRREPQGSRRGLPRSRFPTLHRTCGPRRTGHCRSPLGKRLLCSVSSLKPPSCQPVRVCVVCKHVSPLARGHDKKKNCRLVSSHSLTRASRGSLAPDTSGPPPTRCSQSAVRKPCAAADLAWVAFAHLISLPSPRFHQRPHTVLILLVGPVTFAGACLSAAHRCEMRRSHLARWPCHAMRCE